MWQYSQMVASHFTKDHPQQSICMEEATFYDITTAFISSQKWILVSKVDSATDLQR
jgi:hypothetical protein